MSSRYASLPSDAAAVGGAVEPMRLQTAWIAFEGDEGLDPARDGTSTTTTPRNDDVSRRPRPSPKKRIKRTTVHRTSSSMPVTLEVLQTTNLAAAAAAVEPVDNLYDYSFSSVPTSMIEPPPPPPPTVSASSFPRHVSDELDAYVMRSDMKRSDRSLSSTGTGGGAASAPKLDMERFAPQHTRTLSTSHSSSGSSNERKSSRRETASTSSRRDIPSKTGPSPSMASVPSQRSISVQSKKSVASIVASNGATTDVVSIDLSHRSRGRPSSRTASDSQRSATPSSHSRTSGRSHSQSQSTRSAARRQGNNGTTKSVRSQPSQSRGRSNSSSHRRPPPTRNNPHLERRSRSRSRSASLTRIDNGPTGAVVADAGAAPSSANASVAARSVPSRLPTHGQGPGTPRSTYSAASLSGNRRRSASHSQSQTGGARGAQSIGPGVSYEAKRKGTLDSISGLEFVFPGGARSHDGRGYFAKSLGGSAKPPRVSLMGKIFGGENQSGKATSADPSKYPFRSRTLLAATVYHNTATNLWITTINTNQRGVARDPATANRHLRAFSFSSEREAREAAIANAPPKMMTDDESHHECLLCQQPFNIFRRSLHCRNCGVCVCSQASCSTTWSAKSVPETYNLKGETHVRVCKSCDALSTKFRDALLDGAYEDAVALYGTGNVNLRTPFPVRSRRDEVLFPVHAAVEGGNIDILRWLVDDHYCPVQVVKAGKPNSKSVASMRTPASASLSTPGRNRVPILTSKGRSVLSIALAGARVQILRYLVVECSVSVYESTDLPGCLRSLEAALLFLAPPSSGGAPPLPPTPMSIMTSPNAHDPKSHPASTRSGSVRFQYDGGDEDSDTEDPSSTPVSDDGDDDEPSSAVVVSSRGDVEEVEVESRRSHHTRGSKSRTSHKSSSQLSARSASSSRPRHAPVTSSSQPQRRSEKDGDGGGGSCILCMDRPVHLSGIPCGHEISCSKCHAHLSSCPLCGGPCGGPPPS